MFRYVLRNVETAFDIHNAILFGIIHDAADEFRAQDTANVSVQLIHRNLAILHRLLEFLAIVIVERLFVIQASSRSLYGAVRAAPIGNDEAGKMPTGSEHVGEQIFIFAGEVTVECVIGTHDRSRTPHFDADVKSQQITFLHGALADNYVHFIAPALLIVEGVMFNIADDVLSLLAFDSVADQCSGEDWVFAHVFEGSAVARIAGDVHAAAPASCCSPAHAIPCQSACRRRKRLWGPNWMRKQD